MRRFFDFAWVLLVACGGTGNSLASTDAGRTADAGLDGGAFDGGSDAGRRVPVVNADVAWQLQCTSDGCTSFHAHQQDPVHPRFEAMCKHLSTGLQIVLSDPGDDLIPPSSLELTRLRADGGCAVSVTESFALGEASLGFNGTCESGGGCTLQVIPPQDGWEFQGSLHCDGLSNNSPGPKPVLGAPMDPSAAVVFRVKGCE